ncbi:MAG: dihydropteroate synthase [Victivallaceae bacterium]|nr:dihydropteroate synthase [Victivallaceae bacterium]
MLPTAKPTRRTATNKLPKILGIVNVTPDSFSGGLDPSEARRVALGMIDAGVEAIDVGGESTRPGAQPVPENEEIARVVPVIRAIAEARPQAFISVDTRKSVVARAAVAAGAAMINDVSMLGYDLEMPAVAAELGTFLVICHNRGVPATMNTMASYGDVTEEVMAELSEALEKALAAGVKKEKIILDPNLGFAKNTNHNLEILANLGKLRSLEHPLMIGHSRKRFIGELCNLADPKMRDAATLGLSVALTGRVEWLRVHDAIGHAQAFKLLGNIEFGEEI